MIRTIKDICAGVLDLVYPPFCLVCGRRDQNYLCAKCIEEIDVIDAPFCRKCGTPCEEYKCQQCLEREYHFEYARSAAVFGGALREAIHSLKYKFHLPLADPLADLMARCFHETYLAGRVDLAIPIPIHSSRLLERGFNQAEELALRLRKRISLPVESGVLYKPRKTRHQVDLPQDLRTINVQGAFAVRNTGRIAGKRILLIDDVFTTGSTLSEAARVLREAGAETVHAYTLSRSV